MKIENMHKFQCTYSIDYNLAKHATSFTMFDSYHVGLFTTQTRAFVKIQDGPQCVKRCIDVASLLSPNSTLFSV